MKLSALIAPLIAAKVPHDQIMAVVLAYEAEQSDALEQRRRADAERQARKRDREKSRDVTLRHSDRSLAGDRVTPADDKSQTTVTPSREEITPRAALEAVLDGERADAVIRHRQRIRKPLTGHAAKLLAAKFAQCSDPNAAADTMIGNGWQGFEPEWLSRPVARGSPPKPETPADVASRLLTEMRSANGQSGTSDSRHPQALVAIPGGKHAGHG